MKSIVLSHSETGRLATREVSLGVTTSELKNVAKEAFLALSWADLSDICLSVDGVGGGEGCGSNKEKVLGDEERLCDVVEEMEETKVKVKVHRMLPLCCGGCERPYDVSESEGSGGSGEEKARIALNPCMLQCGHSVCMDCARGMMMKKHDETTSDAVNRHEVRRVKMVCPVAACGRESSWLSAEEADSGKENEIERGGESSAFIVLPPHVAMEEYIRWQRRRVDEESLRRCQTDSEAAMECSECGSGSGRRRRGSVTCETSSHRVYCDQCQPVMSQQHRLVPLSLAEHRSEDILVMADEVKCRKCEAHPEEQCTLYCRSEGCECLVCSRCVFSAQQHFQHEVIPLDEAVASVSKSLEVVRESWLKLIDINMRNVSRSQLSWDEVSSDLENLFDALERRLRELRQSTIEDMRRRYVKAEKSLVEESMRVGEQLGRLHVSIDRCKQLTKCDFGSNPDWVQSYSPGARLETITRCSSVLRTLPEVELDDDRPSSISFPSVTKSVLKGLLSICHPHHLEASRVCGESITVRLHTAFASVGPLNENVVELEYQEIAEDNQTAAESSTDGEVQRVSGVVYDHKFTIRGLTPNKKYRIRIVDNREVELICRTSHLTGGEIWYRFIVSGNAVESDSDVIEALSYYEALSKEGSDGAALASLGVCHYCGIRTTKNVAKAAQLYQAAVNLNNDDGRFFLAKLYETGNGVEKSMNEAVRLYRLAAEQGHPIAQNNLGCCYWDGEGCLEAVKWFRLSAHQRDRYGQYNLGDCYFEGKGVAKDLFEAFRWFQLSADQGYASAHTRLGLCYEKGHGVAKNHNRAMMYYKEGAKRRCSEAKEALIRLSVALE